MMKEKGKPGTCTHHGKNVEHWRIYSKLTQAQLGELVGLTQNRISDLEKQETIDEGMLSKLAAALDISLPLLRECDHEGTLQFGKKAVNVFYVNSGGNVTAHGDVNHTHYPLEKVSELYERIIELTREIESLRLQSGK
jgi:transcriptional regulator with XRE-family HTH domain